MTNDSKTVQGVVKSVNALEKRHNELSDRVAIIENTASENVDIDSVVESVLPEVKKSVTNQINVQWIETLTSEVRSVESTLIFHGVKEGQMKTKSEAKTFLREEMKMTSEHIEEISVMSVSNFGKGKDGKRMSVVVKLGCLSDRNICLGYSRNLSKEINLQKAVPKRYLKKFKEFNSDAWELRQVHDLQTRVEFQGHVLCLKVKVKDDEDSKYSWSIHKEYVPQPNLSQTAKVKVPVHVPGTLPTPPVDKDRHASAIIFCNLKSDKSGDELISDFMMVLSAEQQDLVENIRLTNPTTLTVLCRTPSDAKKLAETAKSLKFEKSDVKIIRPK